MTFRFGALILLAVVAVDAQWLDRKTPGAPRLANGKVDMAAAAPKKGDKPSMEGIWQSGSIKFLQDLSQFVPGGISMTPWTQALVKERKLDENAHLEPDANCLPQGVPKLNATPVPFRIVQNPTETIILYEAFGLYRQIFADGRALPPITNPTWLGYSIGRWEGDVFVIETAGINGKPWLDSAGHPTTEATKVTERLRRKDYGHMEMTITVEDAQAYTKPFTFVEDFVLQPDTEILEFVCLENERDLVHLKKK
jgi:hypothetical protein